MIMDYEKEYNDFVKMMEMGKDTEDEPFRVEMGIEIDGIECQLTVYKYIYSCEKEEKKEEKHTYAYSITNKSPISSEGECKHVSSIKELLGEIKEWSNAKYVGRLVNHANYASLMKQKDWENYNIMRRMMSKMIGGVKTLECYVCYEDTHGHRTKCGHSICARCFYKSLKEDEDDEEFDYMTKFECGICRKTEIAISFG